VTLNTYLVFNGNCEEAFRFYEQVLGGKIVGMFPHEGTPMAEHVPPEWRKKIMHVTLKAGESFLMGSDAPPGHAQPPQGFSVSIAPDSAEGAERIFAALAEGGKIGMPMGQTFWAERFGMTVDRFGVPWMVNFEGKVKYE